MNNLLSVFFNFFQAWKNLEEAIRRNIPRDSSLKLQQDLIITEFELNYGKKDQNPVEVVYFYSKSSPDKAKQIKKEESLMLPERFVYTVYYIEYVRLHALALLL